MTWQRDGSGLDVKRVRGRTVPQCEAATWNRRNVDYPRESKRIGSGWLSDTSFAHKQWQRARQRRRDRRAKRLAKAAARRLDTLPRLRWRKGERVLAIPPEVLRVYLRPWWREQCAERFKFGDQRVGTYADGHVYNISVRTVGSIGVTLLEPDQDSTALFDQARQEADEAIARAIVGKHY